MSRMASLINALWLSFLPVSAFADNQTSVRDGGVSAIWILANLAYTPSENSAPIDQATVALKRWRNTHTERQKRIFPVRASERAGVPADRRNENIGIRCVQTP